MNKLFVDLLQQKGLGCWKVLKKMCKRVNRKENYFLSSQTRWSWQNKRACTSFWTCSSSPGHWSHTGGSQCMWMHVECSLLRSQWRTYTCAHTHTHAHTHTLTHTHRVRLSKQILSLQPPPLRANNSEAASTMQRQVAQCSVLNAALNAVLNAS
jgi:hypothetical protein